jgi:hypothetical protein
VNENGTVTVTSPAVSAISGLSRFAGEKQIGRGSTVPIEGGLGAFRGSFSLPVSGRACEPEEESLGCDGREGKAF